MGNTCVTGEKIGDESGYGYLHSISRSFWSGKSSASIDSGKVMDNPNSSPLKPPGLMTINPQEITSLKPTKMEPMIGKWEDAFKSDQVIMIVTERPKRVQKPKQNPPKQKQQSQKHQISFGLQIDSVLRTKTGHLKEHYHLGEKIGHGRYGKTFRCTDRKTGMNYACKSIAKRNLLTREDVNDVRREVEIMHHLSGHPNLISIKGAYEDAVAVHVVMELCSGGELFDRIVKHGYYSENKAAELIRTIVGVIQSCHSLGVMHRDLKPENFLFINENEDSPIKTIDFGLSVFFKPGEVFTDVVGSPFYIAPEVLCQRYGPEADMWSAGVILYALLCGFPPFCGETEEEIFEDILHGRIDFSSHPWPNISEGAKDLVRKMLIRDPKKRLTAHQVLCHPWLLSEVEAPNEPFEPAFITRLVQFSAMSNLKKMALQVIAAQLSVEEAAGLRHMFKTIDKDNNGQITFEKLKSCLKRFGAKLDESEIHKLLKSADLDNSGTIDCREFIAAMIHVNKFDKDDDRLLKAFSYFDEDGSGYITKDNIRLACEKLGIEDSRWEEMIQEVDQNKDGLIDFLEFMAMLCNGNTNSQ